MSTTFDLDQMARNWLREGPTELSDRVLDEALEEVHRTRQRRAPWAPWRSLSMSAMDHSPLAQAATVAAIGVLAIGAAVFVIASLAVGPSPTPTASAPSQQPTTPAPAGMVRLSGTLLSPTLAGLHQRVLVYRSPSTAATPVGQTVTNVDGRWSLDVEPNGQYCFKVDGLAEPAGGHLPYGATAWSVRLWPGGGWTLADAEWRCISGTPHAVIELEVPDGVVVSGTVVDYTGKPLGWSGTNGRMVTVSARTGDAVAAATTQVDADGRFALTLPEGAWSLTADIIEGAQGGWIGPVDVTVGNAPVTGVEIIRPGSSTTIGGRILDADGGPVRATVQLYRSKETSAYDLVSTERTDAEGRWSFETAVGARLCLRLETPTWKLLLGPDGVVVSESDWECVTTTTAPTAIDVRLPAVRRVTGTIVDSAGVPVGSMAQGKVTVESRVVYANRSLAAWSSCVVDAAGAYAIDLFEGTWDISVLYVVDPVDDSPTGTYTDSVTIAIGAADIKGFEIRLPIAQSTVPGPTP